MLVDRNQLLGEFALALLVGLSELNQHGLGAVLRNNDDRGLPFRDLPGNVASVRERQASCQHQRIEIGRAGHIDGDGVDQRVGDDMAVSLQDASGAVHGLLSPAYDQNASVFLHFESSIGCSFAWSARWSTNINAIATVALVPRPESTSSKENGIAEGIEDSSGASVIDLIAFGLHASVGTMCRRYRILAKGGL